MIGMVKKKHPGEQASSRHMTAWDCVGPLILTAVVSPFAYFRDFKTWTAHEPSVAAATSFWNTVLAPLRAGASGHGDRDGVQVVAAVPAARATLPLRVGVADVHVSAVPRAAQPDIVSASVAAGLRLRRGRAVLAQSAKQSLSGRRVSVS